MPVDRLQMAESGLENEFATVRFLQRIGFLRPLHPGQPVLLDLATIPMSLGSRPWTTV
ncbi:MAG: hypothetical protein U1E70_09795 [Acetobacteraceae bacterium]